MSWHEMLNVVLLNLRTILKVTILSTIFLFLILFFIYPRTYQATVSILPPEQENSLGGFGALLGSGDFSNLIGGGMSSASSQLYVEILKSRTAALYVVKKNKLVEFFKVHYEKMIVVSHNNAIISTFDKRLKIMKNGDNGNFIETV